MSAVIKIIATFFGLGYIPFVPATWTSAAAAVLAWYLPGNYLTGCFVLCAAAGFWACRPARGVFKSDDPGPFVIDEVCGMFLTVFWVPKTLPVYLAAFVLFRLFDWKKPWLIGKIQDQPGAWSIMGDDLLAGVFSNLVLRAFLLALTQAR